MSTKNMLVDIFTKALPRKAFEKFHTNQAYFYQNDVLTSGSVEGPWLGASQQLLCPPKIFSIICLLIFLVSPSYKYSTMLEFLHSTINVHTYNPVFRQLLCIPEIQSSVFISGSQVCILFLHFLNILSLCLWISVPAAQHLDTLCNIQYIFSYNKPMQPLETCNHIMYNCKHYQQSWNPKQQSLKDIITFLEFNQSAFCFQEGITYLSSNLV